MLCGWFFLAVPWLGLLSVVVVFLDQTHLHFLALISCARYKKGAITKRRQAKVSLDNAY